MAIKGSLETTFAVSAAKPGTRNESGYDGLETRTITPSAFTDSEDSLTIPAADYNTLIPGEIISLSAVGSITGLAANTDRYCAKLGSNKIAFSTTLANALASTPVKVALGGTLGSARVVSNNFKPCGEVTSIGEFGREYNTVRVNNLSSGATRKFKGSYDNGTIQADLLFDSDDVGQVVLEQAADSTSTYAFQVGFPGGSGAEDFYFEGLVSGLKRVVGGPDDALMLRVTIELDHNSIVEGT